MIRAVTLDLWGTLFLDGPASDDRYKRQRLAGIQLGPAAWRQAPAVPQALLQQELWTRPPLP